MHTYRAFTQADQTLVGAAAKTVLILSTPSTRRCKIKEASVSFSSVTATDQPVLCELVRFSSAGTNTPMSPVAPAEDSADPPALVTAGYACTVEPSTPVVVADWYQSPIGTTLVYQAPLGEEIVLKVSDFIGIRLTSPQAETGVRAMIRFQE